MAKSQEQNPSPPSEDYATAHPLMKPTQVDLLMDAAAKRREAEEFKIEELQTWKLAVNGLAASPNGAMFLKSMVQYSGMYLPVNTSSAQTMVERGIKSAFYLRWVRPFLNPDLRSSIEC